MRIYAFNGDADGLCALVQLRLAVGDSPSDVLVTGVKRDIQLLARVQAKAGDDCTVLDVSLESNREDLLRLLASGVRVRYFDHHFAGAIPHHPSLEASIDTSRGLCTSILVDRSLDGRHRRWAAVGAFGDNLTEQARRLAESAGVESPDVDELAQLGIVLNYNAYGESIADLHAAPETLAAELLCYRDPLDFVHCSSWYGHLCCGYEDDMERARQVIPTHAAPGIVLVELPGEAWARRTSGTLANSLASAHPTSAIAIVSPRANAYVVSLRVPSHSSVGADEFCRRFPTGGGRRAAAGINHLPSSHLAEFRRAFEEQFRLAD
jgi:hypothetical protein